MSDPATGVWFFPDRPAPELVRAIEHAERAGIDAVWLGDEGPAREPFTVLAAAAASTRRIGLAIGITNPYVRHPAVAAASMATIAELSGGRATLGVGAGGAMSLGPFSIDARRPVEAVERFIRIARASASGTATEGYTPSDLAVARLAPRVPIFVGARGPRLNASASRLADGAFVAGMPPLRFGEVIGWARSERPIEIALYPSVAFDDAARERHRPEMIWSMLDAPIESLASLGVEREPVRLAADALRRGDRAPATALIDDDVLGRLLLLGGPAAVGVELAELWREHRPSTIGLAIVADDLEQAIDDAAAAFSSMRDELGRRP